MKNVMLIALIILFAVFPAFAQNIEQIKEHEAKVEEIIFDSKEMGQKRQVIIQTPMNYNVLDFQYYNVIYVFDAQMRPLFDYTSGIANLMGAGVIVVGVKSTWIKEEMYGRNHDLVPSDTKMRLGPKSGGNAEAFLSFVKNEVMPYVESNYRTMPHNVAVGHSLSASFLLYAMVNEPDLFNNYIAVSPNLAYDNQRLVKDLRNFDSKQFSSPTYLYMSHADEHLGYPEWGKANKNAYTLLRDTLANDNFIVEIEEYPEETHQTTLVPSLHTAMKTYLGSMLPRQNLLLSKEEYEITIRLDLPVEGEEIYIAGNQEALADWQTGNVKMKHISPYEREITLTVHDPVEFNFYKGKGDAKAWVAFGDGGRSNQSIMIRPEEGGVYHYRLDGASNKYINR